MVHLICGNNAHCFILYFHMIPISTKSCVLVLLCHNILVYFANFLFFLCLGSILLNRLGYSTPDITADIYAHYIQAAQEAATDILDDMICSAKGKVRRQIN